MNKKNINAFATNVTFINFNIIKTFFNAIEISILIIKIKILIKKISTSIFATFIKYIIFIKIIIYNIDLIQK